VSNMVVWFSVTNNNSTYSSGKRKARQYSTTQGEKNRKGFLNRSSIIFIFGSTYW
jgi:hypothetical protein